MLRFTEVVGRDVAAGQGAAGQGATGQGGTGQGAGGQGGPGATVTLTFHDRRRSRLLVRLGDGTEAALMLPRGTVLRDGDRLRDESEGALVTVLAAAETLSVARTTDAHLLTRAAYHLGNRHVALQIGPGWLAYQHDHVLDDLARDLGLQVATESAPFEPEAGGYKHAGSHGHGHGDDDDTSHAQGHSHEHDHDHGQGHGHEHGPDHGHEHPHDHEHDHSHDHRR